MKAANGKSTKKEKPKPEEPRRSSHELSVDDVDALHRVTDALYTFADMLLEYRGTQPLHDLIWPHINKLKEIAGRLK